LANQKNGYEERYQRLYAAGALFWNSPVPNPYLARLLERLPAHSLCIELGCGEGYQVRFMVSKGHSVTAIDLSPTAIEKATQNTSLGLPISYLVGDVTDLAPLHLDEKRYDLAVDIGCLHMMTEDEDRYKYLAIVHKLLKPGGRFFIQNGLDIDDIQPQTEEEARQLVEERKLKLKPSGYLDTRKIKTASGEREVILPLLPCKMLSLDGYISELTIHEFRILSAERVREGVNCSYEAVIIAENT
jgi:SAM-dependent methyltransferase